MTTFIPDLINTPDTFEVVRDQIAQILANEVASQKSLAEAGGLDPTAWSPRVFIERSNPWSYFQSNENPDQASIVNVWYDKSDFNQGHGQLIERQRADGLFNVDVYARGVAHETSAVGTHAPGDEQAALRAHRSARLIRQILMAGGYTYLDLRGIVARRYMSSMAVFQPPESAAGNAVQVVAVRLALAVEFNEYSPQMAEETLEAIAVDVHRAEDGAIVAQSEITYPLT